MVKDKGFVKNLLERSFWMLNIHRKNGVIVLVYAGVLQELYSFNQKCWDLIFGGICYLEFMKHFQDIQSWMNTYWQLLTFRV